MDMRSLTAFSCLMTGAFLILNAHPASSTSSPLSNRLAVIIGDNSYSLYLVHFPVIFVFDYMMVFVTTWVYLSFILTIFALSYITWLFVEQSIREIGSHKQVLRTTCATMLVAFVVADNSNVVRRLPFYSTIGLAANSDGFHNFWWTRLEETGHLFKHAATFKSERGYREYDGRTSSYFAHIKSPTYASNGTLIAVGNSYVQSSGAMLLAFAEKNNLDLKIRHITTCSDRMPQCGLAFDEVIDLIKSETMTVFIYTAFLLPKEKSFLYKKFPEVLDAAGERHVPVIIQGLSPRFTDYNPKQCVSPFKRHGDACATSVTVETMLERLPAVRSRISLLAGERNRALVWNPWKYFCTLVVCRNSVDGVSLFRDAHHFSNYGSLLTYDDFAKFLARKSAICRESQRSSYTLKLPPASAR